MVCSIVDLQDLIIEFLHANAAEMSEVMTRTIQLKSILQDFEETLKPFEQDEVGLIGFVHWRLKSLEIALDEIEGDWAPAARKGKAKLQELRVKHSDAMEPICLIATRLNPGLDPAEAIGEKEVNTLDRLICAALGG
jgi:hypothetical protein